MGERKEALMRIIVGIVSGIIFAVWRWLIGVFAIVNFVYTIFAGKRLKELAVLSEIWNSQWYVFQRYLIFLSNKRPFPFSKLEKSMSKFEKK
tara:strand:- start:314 stop:589 length:276 start_codon:yes stop_codon:yes gene_type:complete